MKLKEYLKLFEKIDFYISIKSTGKPNDFARKLKISERSLYKYLNDMKELGAPIEYSKLRNSYLYINTGNFHIGFLNKSNMKLGYLELDTDAGFSKISTN
jgi:hypothetical protein